ncbi:MAG: YjbQ family protein [Acidobacteria bacterium]|nr:YjbQ family protein [Acidobacteriota bacterium]
MITRDFVLQVRTKGYCDVVDITVPVSERLEQSGIYSGSVLVFVMGSTAGITTVEYEPGLVKDLEEFFNRIIPATRDYHHEKTWHDGNGFSHLRASLLKPSLTIPVYQGRMRLGTWQQIVLIDFDNRSRDREVAIQVTGIPR